MASRDSVTDPVPAADEIVITAAGNEHDEKRVADVTDHATDEDSDQLKDDFPLRWKLTALVCGIALSWGSSFSENTLGPLKSTLIKKLDITNSQVSIRRT